MHGIAAENGEEIRAPIVIAALNPRTTIVDLLQDDEDWAELRGRMARRTMRGRAFKIVLALDGMPHFAAARDEAEAQRLAAAQFRIAPDIDYLEEAHGDMISGPAFHQAGDLGLVSLHDVAGAGTAGSARA